MGNTVAAAVRDITEDGNKWQDDRVSLPTFEDELFGWGFDKEQPSLVVAPMALSKQAVSRSDLSSELSEESSTRETELEAGEGSDHSATHARSTSSLPPFEDPLRKNPDQLVFQPGACDGPWRGRGQAAAWRPLHSCRALQGRALLTESRLAQLRPHLPVATRFASCWRLIYSPRVHGVSLGTFFRQCQAWPGESLLLVEDSEGTVFGGFASHTWRASSVQLHCGRPECFVFTFGSPRARRVERCVPLGMVCAGALPQRLVVSRVHERTWAEAAGVVQGDELIEVDGTPVAGMEPPELDRLMREKRPLRVVFARRDELATYPWAGGNHHFMFANWDGLSMGGGNDSAFWIKKDFLTGTSAASNTFANPGPLASSAEFVLRNFECWAFDSSLTVSEELSCQGLSATSPPEMSQHQRLRQQASSALRFGTLL